MTGCSWSAARSACARLPPTAARRQRPCSVTARRTTRLTTPAPRHVDRDHAGRRTCTTTPAPHSDATSSSSVASGGPVTAWGTPASWWATPGCGPRHRSDCPTSVETQGVRQLSLRRGGDRARRQGARRETGTAPQRRQRTRRAAEIVRAAGRVAGGRPAALARQGCGCYKICIGQCTCERGSIPGSFLEECRGRRRVSRRASHRDR